MATKQIVPVPLLRREGQESGFEGGFQLVSGALAEVEALAHRLRWGVRGRIATMGGGDRWYTKDGRMLYVTYGKGGRIASVVGDDGRWTGAAKLERIAKYLSE